MSWIIDEFSAKSGFLASWRYKRVLIDDNGILSTANVPGKEAINQPCISDYNKKSRRYANNQLITEFCNTTTFTNYRVYAQDCDPFAYVQSDINAPKCGYLEPLPAPAVPTSPFSAAVYGPYKFFEFCSIEHVNFRVNIYKKDFVGAETRISLGDADPVQLIYNTEDPDNKFSPIRSVECNLSFICDENFSLQELYTADERAYKVEVLNIDTSETEFIGFIIPDSCREPFAAPPYAVTIRATDGIGALKNITYPLPVGSKINIRQSFKDILCYCFAMTNLNLDLLTICNLYEVKMTTGMDDDPLALATVNPIRLSDDQGDIKTCYEVLVDICTIFGAYVSQVKGRWSFVRISELSNSIIRGRVYMYTGFFKRSEQIDNSRLASNTDEDVTVLNGGVLRTANAYKRVTVLTGFGNAATALYNGDFEIWDGQNFKYWTKYGGINISRIQKTIKGTGGALVPILDYAVQFNLASDASRWLESSPVYVEKGDKITFSANIGTGGDRLQNEVKLRLIIGDYQLHSTFDGTTLKLEWVRQQTTVLFTVPDAQDINTFKYSFTIPECPIDGDMYLQIYGSTRYSMQRVNGRTTPVFTPAPYMPISFDNISLSKGGSSDKERDGFWSISEQLGFYTNSPEEIKIPFGDSQVPKSAPNPTGTGRPRPIPPEESNLSTLYAIYTSDNSYSTLWKDFNESGEPLPIGLCLARTILRAYQMPFRFYEGSFRGENLHFLNIFRFDIAGDFGLKQFATMSADFSLKYHEMSNAILAEIFTKAIFTNNFQVPHSPGQVPPAITQNPNNPINDVRIFSDEFTSPFS